MALTETGSLCFNKVTFTAGFETEHGIRTPPLDELDAPEVTIVLFSTRKTRSPVCMYKIGNH